MALREVKFAHEPIYCSQRGKIKVYCRCGQQSKGKLDSMDEAIHAHVTHVGLKELERKQKLR